MIHIVLPATFIEATLAENKTALATPFINLEASVVLVTVGVPSLTIAMSLVIFPLSMVHRIRSLVRLHCVSKPTLTMFHTMKKLAFIGASILGGMLSTAVLQAVKPRTLVRLTVIVHVNPDSGEFPMREPTFISLGLAHNILSVSMLLTGEPIPDVKAAIRILHPTFTLNHVLEEVTQIDISVRECFFTMTNALSILEASFIDLRVFRF